MVEFKTEQEKFWHGSFGDEYIERNKSEDLVLSNIALFNKVFEHVYDVNSLIEFGSNIGLNLVAINRLFPRINLSAIEINASAVNVLRSRGNIEIYQQSILDFTAVQKYDMVLIKGVLIHIAPEELNIVYDKLYASSNRYICIADYYNPTPVEVTYRGHAGKLFKRDFAGEMLDRFSDLRLLDYGFVYHRDNHFDYGDITWFVLEKR